MIRYMVFNKDIYDSYVEDNINNKYANNIINKQLIYFNPFSIVGAEAHGDVCDP